MTNLGNINSNLSSVEYRLQQSLTGRFCKSMIFQVKKVELWDWLGGPPGPNRLITNE